MAIHPLLHVLIEWNNMQCPARFNWLDIANLVSVGGTNQLNSQNKKPVAVELYRDDIVATGMCDITES